MEALFFFMAYILQMHRGAGREKFPFSCSFLKYAIFAFYTAQPGINARNQVEKICVGKNSNGRKKSDAIFDVLVSLIFQCSQFTAFTDVVSQNSRAGLSKNWIESCFIFGHSGHELFFVNGESLINHS
jgi:hypothetical protein